ncbi:MULTISPECIES: thiolase family protein [Bacteria]|uniref:thiolase family protein n=1 Tax=Bacteria TaxID=2 RepID=UPI003C7DFBB0
MTGAAIVGLGTTAFGKIFDRSAQELAAEAVRAAVADAGLGMDAIDGLLVTSGLGGELTPQLAGRLGLSELALLASVGAYGASAGVMVGMCAQAIAARTATTIVCIFADTPLRENTRSGRAWESAATDLEGPAGWRVASGGAAPNVQYALAARRHMEAYGTTTAQLGEIAVAQRLWAAGNPLARFRDPITIEDHQSSPWIATPLRRLDCCVVSNGAVAVVVTSSERANDLARPPIQVRGHGQAHRPRQLRNDSSWGLVTAAPDSWARASAMAGVTLDDLDVVELYDCYTYTVLVTLEDYGFCAKGEGGSFVEERRLRPGGGLACNTGGGQLSSFYMWGFTPLSEAVLQLRGDGGERQVPGAETALVSGNGGILEYHSTLVLGRDA